MKDNYTPEKIISLNRNEVFVFGSNLAGNHAGGAAQVARDKFGAVMGQGVGLQGQSYAIPTMQGGIETIKPYIDEFISFATDHPELKFYVTRIGCGIAGFTDEQIAPLFDAAFDLPNVVLPESFSHIINHARQLASETSAMVFHCVPIEYFPEDLAKADGMGNKEKIDFFISLKKNGRYKIKHESPMSAGLILNTDDMGHHKIALTENEFAIAAGKKLYSKNWDWGIDFDCDILSVIPIEKKSIENLTKNYGNFAVLLSDGHIYYVWSDSCIKPLFPTNDFIAVESGCGGLVFGLRNDGTVSVAFGENNPNIVQEVRNWTDITRISSSENHIIGLMRNRKVIVGGDKQYFEDIDKWRNIKKVFAFDTYPFAHSQNDQVYGIDEDGWLYVAGCPWINVRQYWRKLNAQYDVNDIISNNGATLIRYSDGSCKLITPHAIHNFEKDMEFIHHYDNFRYLAARGDMVVIVDEDGEFRVDINKEERKWWK